MCSVTYLGIDVSDFRNSIYLETPCPQKHLASMTIISSRVVMDAAATSAIGLAAATLAIAAVLLLRLPMGELTKLYVGLTYLVYLSGHLFIAEERI